MPKPTDIQAPPGLRIDIAREHAGGAIGAADAQELRQLDRNGDGKVDAGEIDRLDGVSDRRANLAQVKDRGAAIAVLKGLDGAARRAGVSLSIDPKEALWSLPADTAVPRGVRWESRETNRVSQELFIDGHKPIGARLQVCEAETPGAAVDQAVGAGWRIDGARAPADRTVLVSPDGRHYLTVFAWPVVEEGRQGQGAAMFESPDRRAAYEAQPLFIHNRQTGLREPLSKFWHWLTSAPDWAGAGLRWKNMAQKHARQMAGKPGG